MDFGFDQDWILGWSRIGSGLAKEWLRIGQGLVLDWPHVDADLVLLSAFRPPSRLGTIPYRGLVPRLSRQMSSVMAQDWHWIGQLALDWPIGTGLTRFWRLEN